MKNVTKKTRILDSLVREFRNNKFRFTDVIRTAYEINYGIGNYTTANRGYYNSPMSAEEGYSPFGKNTPVGYLRKPGRDPRFLDKNTDGTYSIVS